MQIPVVVQSRTEILPFDTSVEDSEDLLDEIRARAHLTEEHRLGLMTVYERPVDVPPNGPRE